MKKTILIAAILLMTIITCSSVYAKIDKNNMSEDIKENNKKTNENYFCKDGQSYKYSEEGGTMKIIQVEVKNNPCASRYNERNYIENRMLEDMHPSKIIPPIGNYIR